MRRLVLLLTVMAAALVLASGVALAVNRVGTNGHDVLKGTDGKDNLIGLGGQDDLFGKGGGSDNLVGGEGKDNVLAGDERRLGRGDKNLVGGPGNDVVLTGKGSDNAVGGDGNDFLFECCLREFSKDTLSGGSGNDVIDVSHKPAVQDVVTCGSGFDRVLSDRADRVAPDCEKVVVVHGSVEDVFRQFDEFIESVPESFFRGLPPNPFR